MGKYTGMTASDGKPVLAEEFVRDVCGAGTGTSLAPQRGPQEDALRADADILITGGNRGGGKANTYATPVLTPRGFVPMGSLKTGDTVVTPWEGPQEVTAIYEQGPQHAYALHFDDGTSVAATQEHLFWAKAPEDAGYSKMTMRQIMNHYVIGSKGAFALRRGEPGLLEIPLPPPVDFGNGITMEDLPVHPEVLGMVMAKGVVNFTRYGAWLGHYRPGTNNALYKLGYFLKIKDRVGYVSGISDDARRRISKSRGNAPASIPDIYMTADIESRTAFVQGVFFANPHFYKGHLYIRLPNRKFITQLAEMCRSLGWWAGVTEEYDPVDGQRNWRMLLVAPDDGIPGKHAWNGAKRGYLVNAKVPKSRDDVLGLSKKIIAVSSIDKRQECRCITVSGHDHLYLTGGYNINHNTFTLLMDTLYDIGNSRFNSIIFRKEKDDLTNIIRTSQEVFKGEGAYNRSRDDMTWYFNSGATLELTYYNQSLADFKDRFQGRQYAYIGVDEITQLDYAKFKYLITTNRNAAAIRNRIIGTCNPDPTSWVRSFIGWWIGPDGDPVRERDGVTRYCYMTGDDVNEIVWGDTRDEVYGKCKGEIDRLWEATWGDDTPPDGYTPQRMFTKSVTFIRAELKYNKFLVDNDPAYFANLAQQSEEQKARDLLGNWNFMAMGDDLIKMADLQACFDNAQQLGDGIRRVSCDVAFTGGDQCVMWLWAGWHVQDIYVCRLDSKSTVGAVRAKLTEWGVTEDHFTYDLNGLGQTFKGFFKRALPFNNLEAVRPEFKNVYDNVKSQCAYEFGQRILDRRVSFNPSILDRRFSGKGYRNRPLRDILQTERKCIRQDADKADKGWCLIRKAQMKQLVGHSPDFFEALLMREIFEVRHTRVEIPDWAYRF